MGLRSNPGQDMPNNYFDELRDGFPLILDDLFLIGDVKLTNGCKRDLQVRDGGSRSNALLLGIGSVVEI